MKVILDTNVFLSGIFFSGPPYEILSAWRCHKITLVASLEILEEYERVEQELHDQFPKVDIAPFLALIKKTGKIINAPPLPEQVCTDADDDKFLACALAGKTKIVISGDKALRKTSGYAGIKVMTAREFIEHYLVGIS